MEPLSKTTRRFVFYFFVLLFLAVIPVILLYAGGYRVTKKFTLVETGGIFIDSPFAASQIYLDGVLERETGFFQKSILIQNLAPKEYVVEVKKQGYSSWQKKITVEKGYVAQGYAFLVPLAPLVISVPRIDAQGNLNAEYENAENMFTQERIFSTRRDRELSAELGATFRVDKNVALWSDGKTVNAAWLGSKNATPYFFCNAVCVSTSTVYAMKGDDLDFFPGRSDVFFVVNGTSLFATELDTRYPQNTAYVYRASSTPLIRVVNNVLYIREGEQIKKITF